jgi:hypothetical protein
MGAPRQQIRIEPPRPEPSAVSAWGRRSAAHRQPHDNAPSRPTGFYSDLAPVCRGVVQLLIDWDTAPFMAGEIGSEIGHAKAHRRQCAGQI